MELTAELFLIPDGPAYLIYSPLKRIIFRVGGEVVNMLASLQEGHTEGIDPSHPIIETLKQCGIIDGSPDVKPQVLQPSQYKPTHVTLFLTSRCNLGCRYCYANSNSEILDMPEELGRQAIDYIARNCVEKNLKTLNVGFHGGGEPTLAWPLLEALTAYAGESALKHGLEIRTGISTNACISPSRAKWMAKNLSFVSLSIDGPPEIQDRQRPFPDGTPSSPVVEAVARVFDEDNFPYSIQSTITNESVHFMPEAVRYFSRAMKPRFLKFEPVSDAGRYAEHPEMVPDMKEFAHYYNRAQQVAMDEKVKLIFSGIRPWGSSVSYFCGAFIEPFTITPDGYVTACYEVCSQNTPYQDIFLIGQYNKETKDFDIDWERLNRLRERNVDRLEPCKNCFCKYSCAGDCATRNFRNYRKADLSLVGARCEAIREITRSRLSRYVDQATQPKDHTKQEAPFS